MKKPRFTPRDVGRAVRWKRYPTDHGIEGVLLNVGGELSYVTVKTFSGTQMTVSPADLEFIDAAPVDRAPEPARVWAGRRERKPAEKVQPAREWVDSEKVKMNLAELICGDVNRLSYVPRYSTTFLIRSENVAEHTALVSLYCVFIARWVESNTPIKIDMGKLMVRAAIHDLEEVRSGDTNRTYKHYDQLLRTKMNEVSGELLAESIAKILPRDEGFTQRTLLEWQNSKDDSPEGRILSLADFLQALSFISREYALGNRSVTEPPVSLPHHFKELEEPSFDFLRPLVDQARRYITDTF